MTSSEQLRSPYPLDVAVFTAIAGVLMPAGIYLALQWGDPGQRGWAVPMATDIAFVVGVLACSGNASHADGQLCPRE